MKITKINQKAIIIPGAQKSGTTTLFEILVRHRMISNSEAKEPTFFRLRKKEIKKNINFYLDFFEKNKIIIDASTPYLYSEHSLNMIKEFVENPKIIIILRDPMKRTYSSYLHMYKKSACYEKRSFDDILNKIKGPGFDNIKKSENLLLKEAIKKRRVDGSYFKRNIVEKEYKKDFRPKNFDNLWIYKYFQGSLYTKYIKKYKKMFGKNVKIIFFEKLIHNTENTINDILKFLELKRDSITYNLPKSNITLLPKNKFAKTLLEIRRKNPLFKFILESNGLRKIFSGLFGGLFFTPKLSKVQYNVGREILKKEYEYWFGQDDELKKYWRHK